MEPQTNHVTEVTKTLATDQKSFIGFLLSIGGVVFLLGGLTFFIALLSIMYIKPDLIIGLIVGSLVVGTLASATGLGLLNK